MNLSWWLERAAIEHPDKTAIIDASGTSIAYRDLLALTQRIGRVLREDLGVKPDDVVVTCVRDNFLHVAIMYATMRIGAIFSGLNHKQLHEKFHADIARCTPKAAIVAQDFPEIADLIGSHPDINVAMTTGDHTRFQSLDRLIASKPTDLRSSRAAGTISPRSTSRPVRRAPRRASSSLTAGSRPRPGARSSSPGSTAPAATCRWSGMFHSGGIADATRMVMAGRHDRVERRLGCGSRGRPEFARHKINFAYYIVPTHAARPDAVTRNGTASISPALRTHLSGRGRVT